MGMPVQDGLRSPQLDDWLRQEREALPDSAPEVAADWTADIAVAEGAFSEVAVSGVAVSEFAVAESDAALPAGWWLMPAAALALPVWWAIFRAVF